MITTDEVKQLSYNCLADMRRDLQKKDKTASYAQQVEAMIVLNRVEKELARRNFVNRIPSIV